MKKITISVLMLQLVSQIMIGSQPQTIFLPAVSLTSLTFTNSKQIAVTVPLAQYPYMNTLFMSGQPVACAIIQTIEAGDYALNFADGGYGWVPFYQPALADTEQGGTPPFTLTAVNGVTLNIPSAPIAANATFYIKSAIIITPPEKATINNIWINNSTTTYPFSNASYLLNTINNKEGQTITGTINSNTLTFTWGTTANQTASVTLPTAITSGTYNLNYTTTLNATTTLTPIINASQTIVIQQLPAPTPSGPTQPTAKYTLPIDGIANMTNYTIPSLGSAFSTITSAYFQDSSLKKYPFSASNLTSLNAALASHNYANLLVNAIDGNIAIERNFGIRTAIPGTVAIAKNLSSQSPIYLFINGNAIAQINAQCSNNTCLYFDTSYTGLICQITT